MFKAYTQRYPNVRVVAPLAVPALSLIVSLGVVLNPEDRFNKVARVFGGKEVVSVVLWKDWKIGIIGNADELRKAVRSFLSERTGALSFDYRKAQAEYEQEERWLSTIR